MDRIDSPAPIEDIRKFIHLRCSIGEEDEKSCLIGSEFTPHNPHNMGPDSARKLLNVHWLIWVTSMYY